MKLPFYLCSLFLLTSVVICKAQVHRDLSNELISRKAADSITKNAFGKMVAGSEDVTSLANYVSFEPTDGEFKLSGNYFFQVPAKNAANKKRKSEYFAIGFNGSGSIVNGTVATLFESGKLNTGVDLGFKLSWKFNNHVVGSIASASIPMIEKRNALQNERDYKIDSARKAIALMNLKLIKDSAVLAETREKLKNTVADTIRFNAIYQSCNTDSCRVRLIDSILSVQDRLNTELYKIKGLVKDSIQLREMYDASKIDPSIRLMERTEREQVLSANYGMSRRNVSFQDTIVNKIWKEYEDKIYEVEMARPVTGMRINWISAIFNWNRVVYRTYYDSLPFANALTKVKTPGHTVGLQANFYTFYKPVQRARLLTVALLFKKTTNLEELTASKLTDEDTVVNGSIIRKSSTEYTVYTDPVEVYNTVQLPVDYYRFFGKQMQFGWHAFALADWRNTGKSIYDVGAGFIFGLNTAGAKRLFNVEIFAKYKDITKQIVDEDETGWKQLQFGLSVAIPFMIYKN